MLDLKLKIPPLLLTIVFAAVMWLVSISLSPVNVSDTVRLFISVVLVVLGVSLSISGVISFRFAQTTVNPLLPSSSTALVKLGVYRVSRNPMYLGFLLILIGWGFFLSNLYSLSLPVFFIFYMNLFQIHPEEAILQEIFGEKYSEYKKQVRRWI